MLPHIRNRSGPSITARIYGPGASKAFSLLGLKEGSRFCLLLLLLFSSSTTLRRPGTSMHDDGFTNLQGVDNEVQGTVGGGSGWRSLFVARHGGIRFRSLVSFRTCK